MTNMSSKKKAEGPPTTIPGKKDEEMGETYMMPDESKEDVANDLDDFEARLEGRSSGAKGGPSSKKSANRPVPKSNVPPMFVPKAYNKVHLPPNL